MTADASKGFFLSALLHGGVVALLFLGTYIAKQNQPEMARVFELVAGEGNNYAATAAPALGNEGPLKVNAPTVRAPEPTPPQPVKIEPAPAPPVKKEVTPKPKEETTPNFAKQIKQDIRKGESKAKKEIAKEKKEEEKRAADERKRMTEEEYRKTHKVASATPTKTGAPNVPKIDAEGIKKGVLGGSPKVKEGASGTALTATEGSLAERYLQMLKQKLLDEVESRSLSLPDGLRAEAEFHIMPDGRLVRAKITKSSRNDAFDAAVLEAIAAIKMPARPKGVEELFQVPFVTTPKDRR